MTVCITIISVSDIAFIYISWLCYVRYTDNIPLYWSPLPLSSPRDWDDDFNPIEFLDRISHARYPLFSGSNIVVSLTVSIKSITFFSIVLDWLRYHMKCNKGRLKCHWVNNYELFSVILLAQPSWMSHNQKDSPPSYAISGLPNLVIDSVKILHHVRRFGSFIKISFRS